MENFNCYFTNTVELDKHENRKFSKQLCKPAKFILTDGWTAILNAIKQETKDKISIVF